MNLLKKNSTHSARIEFSIYDDGPDKNRDERMTAWDSGKPRGVSELVIKRSHIQKQLIDSSNFCKIFFIVPLHDIFNS